MATAIDRAALPKHIAYQQSNDDGWEHTALARELHRWVGIFNEEWGLGLPSLPVLHFQPIRNAYATYQFGRGAIGTSDNVTMNTDLLERPAAHVIRTLGHELLHFWQRYHGHPSKQRNYHNDEFVAKARAVGILIDEQGCTSGHTEVFAALIAKHGIDLPNATPEPSGQLIAPTGGVEPKVYGTRRAAGRGSRLRKWCCGCTIVRCSVNLGAVCALCGHAFELAD